MGHTASLRQRDDIDPSQGCVKFAASIFVHLFPLDCGDSTIETLTDVCGEYMKQMTTLLRQAVDNEAMSGTTGFQVIFLSSPVLMHVELLYMTFFCPFTEGSL